MPGDGLRQGDDSGQHGEAGQELQADHLHSQGIVDPCGQVVRGRLDAEGREHLSAECGTVHGVHRDPDLVVAGDLVAVSAVEGRGDLQRGVGCVADFLGTTSDANHGDGNPRALSLSRIQDVAELRVLRWGHRVERDAISDPEVPSRSQGFVDGDLQPIRGVDQAASDRCPLPWGTDRDRFRISIDVGIQAKTGHVRRDDQERGLDDRVYARDLCDPPDDGRVWRTKGLHGHCRVIRLGD